MVAIGIHCLQQFKVFGLNNFLGNTITSVVHDAEVSMGVGVRLMQLAAYCPNGSD
ncbi:hypothetical protein L682_04360 [Aquipseudomonas alcaligenes OT 69]|nr:hypothetical protein L682_04360 [Pseudomonas alcaligenes OT 69]